MAKISLTQLILEKLTEVTELTLEGLLPNSRAEARAWRGLLGLSTDYKFSPKTLSAVLYRLRKQGLVTNIGQYRKLTWSLTKRGKFLLRPGRVIKPLKPDGIPRLVMFDIPESERAKRDWLRTELVSLSFEQLQKSVWIGYCPLPAEFIKLLHKLNLRDKVHIVGIDRGGTVEKV